MINIEFMILAKYAKKEKDGVKTFGELCLRQKDDFTINQGKQANLSGH